MHVEKPIQVCVFPPYAEVEGVLFGLYLLHLHDFTIEM